ncbi:hypothetical protein CLU79DRAFT_805091 [Phycomyces nitens]|nr:hypothetical protein CLU79DRAFT_805091 [Phycomyces nitens]
MLVKDLPADQRQDLQDLTNDISNLFKSISSEYLEQWRLDCDHGTLTDCPEGVKQVQQGSKAIGLDHLSKYIRVEPDYYDWELQQRAVQAPSREHMCKSVVLENTRCTHNSIEEYVKPVNTQKLLNFVRDLKDREISKKYYNFRLADSEKSLELTGYKSGGVCPVGMTHPVPVILAKSILDLEVI